MFRKLGAKEESSRNHSVADGMVFRSETLAPQGGNDAPGACGEDAERYGGALGPWRSPVLRAIAFQPRTHGAYPSARWIAIRSRAPRDERFGPLLRGDERVGTTSPNDEARLLTGAGHVGSTGNKRTKVVPTPGVDWTSTVPLWL